MRWPSPPVGSFCRNVLHWRAAEDAIYPALNDYLPGEMAAFIKRNLSMKGDLHLGSMVLLLFTANGIFEPLEVALNRAWDVKYNRFYLKNQLVALGMIFACGGSTLKYGQSRLTNVRCNRGKAPSAVKTVSRVA